MFRNLASQSRLGSRDFESGPFKLFCDDLRPANVLVNADFKIVAVTDWEFTYTAPAEFTFDPPWWLLLELPEYWSKGLDDWAATYEQRLATFLRMLETRERDIIQRGMLKSDQVLSTRMRESWESGAFWVSYAARKSWAFDAVFWNWLERKFFGDSCGESLESKIQLLTSEEQSALEPFVERKLEE